MPVLKLSVSEEDLSKLEGEGDVAFLIALPMDGQRQVVHVHLRRRKSYDFIYATSRVQSRDRDVAPPVVKSAWLEPE